MNIYKDVEVINSIKTESDHRMVRGKIRINTKNERRKLTPLCMAFIDFEKACDTLENQHIKRQYIELIKYIYDNVKI